jgi:hypothetical protein
MARIIGLLFSGFMLKLYAVTAAAYTAHYAYVVVSTPMAQISNALVG